MTANTLYYGDNLDILRRYVKDESVDLIYLDPPFNSKASYNVLFKERTGEASAAQIKAFDDTWHWGNEAENALKEILGSPLAAEMTKKVVSSLCESLGRQNDMTAYLVMMTVRLLELRRVLKQTGSLYLHCDPTASHYLKIVLDTLFGVENFRNEVVWQRTLAKGLMTRRLPNNHDVIFCYGKTGEAFWSAAATFKPYDSADLDEKTAGKYSHRDPDGRLYQLSDLTNPNPDRPNLTYEFLGVTKVWRWTKDRMQKAYDAGLVVQPSPGAVPRLKRYLDEQHGRPLGDVWSDIPPLNSQARERLGYATQKPLALLERIIQASSKEGDTVLDPFCGCGTAICAAHKLGRQWAGIDITHLAVALMKHRLKDMFGLEPREDYGVVGEPTDVAGARQLAADNRHQFQYWALSLIEARPEEQKKGADRGVDGTIFFLDGPQRTAHKAVIQVKSGHVSSPQIRDLKGVLEREKAAQALFITLEEPTRDMRTEAVSAGFFHSDLMEKDYPKVQMLTVAELLAGKSFDMPGWAARPAQFQKAVRVRRKEGSQGSFLAGGAW